MDAFRLFTGTLHVTFLHTVPFSALTVQLDDRLQANSALVKHRQHIRKKLFSVGYKEPITCRHFFHAELLVPDSFLTVKLLIKR